MTSELFPPEDDSAAAQTHRRALELVAGGLGLFAAISMAIRLHNRAEQARPIENAGVSYSEKIDFLAGDESDSHKKAILAVTAGAIVKGLFTPRSLREMTFASGRRSGSVFGDGMHFLQKGASCLEIEAEAKDPRLTMFRLAEGFTRALYDNWAKLPQLVSSVQAFDPDFTAQTLLDRLPEDVLETRRHGNE